MTTHEPGLDDYPYSSEPPEPPQPPQPPRKRWYRGWPTWTGIGVVVVVITALIASLAGGGGSKPTAQPTNPPSTSLSPAQAAPPTDEPPTTEPPTTASQPPAVSTLKLAETAHITDDDSYEWTGTFDMAVLRPLGLVQRDNGDRILAFAVTVSNVHEAADSDGLSVFDGKSSNLFTTPPTLTDDSFGGIGGGANAPSRAACGNYKPLADVTQNTAKPVTGCVWFYLSPGERPDTISYSSDITDPAGTMLASWSFTMPNKSAPPVFEGLTYTVTSDGGISSVTYGTANFNQAQDTNVQGSTWSKSLPQGAEPKYPVITAQAGDGATTISCKIVDGGEVQAEQTSHGQYAVVTCSAP